MEPGDAAFFDGMLPHAFDILGEEEVEVLFVAVAARRAGGGRPGGSTLFEKDIAWWMQN